MQWLLEQRIQRARELLETTDLTIDRVATEAAFGTSAALRQQFRQTLRVTPHAYRTTFGATGRHRARNLRRSRLKER